MSRCINNKNVKSSNRSTILMLLYCRGAMSRKELANITGLTPAAVSLLIGEMIEQNIVAEIREQAAGKKVGRREIMVDILRPTHVCIGVSLSVKNESQICLMDFRGQILMARDLLFDPCETGEELADLLVAELAEYKSFCEQHNLVLVGLGVSLRGIVNSVEGVWIDTYGVVAQKNVKLRDLLRERLRIPVVIEDNVRAMAGAEVLLSGGETSGEILFVKYGPGLGAAVCIQNEVYNGANFKAAELGHTRIQMGEKSYGLEDLLSYTYICDQVKEKFSAEAFPILYALLQDKKEELTIQHILDSYEMGDPGAAKVIHECQRNILIGVYNAACFFDPREIVFYGKAFELKRFCEDFWKQIEESDELGEYKKSMRKSGFNTEFIGKEAATLALRLFLENGGYVHTYP